MYVLMYLDCLKTSTNRPTYSSHHQCTHSHTYITAGPAASGRPWPSSNTPHTPATTCPPPRASGKCEGSFKANTSRLKMSFFRRAFSLVSPQQRTSPTYTLSPITLCVITPPTSATLVMS